MSKFLPGLVVMAALLGTPVAAQQPGAAGDPAKPAAAGQQQGGQDDAEPLSLQKRAYDKFQDLKSSMQKLQQQLDSADPEKAKRLRTGLLLIRERNIETQMREIEAKLKAGSWQPGLELMDRVQKDLGQLLSLLMDRDVDLQALLEEIARLEDFKKKVEKLIDEQKAEKEASAKAEAIEKQLKAIEQAKADIKRLIEEQEKLKSDTEAQGAGQKESAPLAKKQGELQQDAKTLEGDLREIEKRAQDIAAAEKGGEGKPSEGQPGEGKPSEGKPSEGQPSEGKPSEGSPGEGKPSEGKPGEGSGEGKGKGGGCSSCAGSASQSMGKSKQKLDEDKPEDSLDDQEKALDELKKAEDQLKELEDEARRQLEELPFERFAREQLQTLEKTADLAEEMKKAEDGKGEGDDGAGKPVPGQQNVQQAVPQQKNAAGSLKEYKAGKAKDKQQDAQDQLEDAKKKLEDALAQLRQELREEVLRALEERFTEMLARQRETTRDTIMTEAWRGRVAVGVRAGQTPSQVKDRCLKLSTQEAGLKQEALDALTLIDAEGSAAVFPEVVKTLAADFGLAASMLEGFATGDDTQRLQKEIERTLELLIEALTQQIEMVDGGGT